MLPEDLVANYAMTWQRAQQIQSAAQAVIKVTVL
jgi:hypothetical protein